MKWIEFAIALLLAMPQTCVCADEAPQPLAVAPLADDAFLLGAKQAGLLKSGPAGNPELETRPDQYGFAATQIIAPVNPGAGALVWNLHVSKPGRYLATLEFAQKEEGNAFEVRVGSMVLKGFAPGTRDNLILMDLGGIDLAAGRQSLVLSNTTAIDGKTFMSVGSIYLRPASQEGLTLPQIRTAIASHTPRNLPAELLVPDIFSDHMVLQRGKPVPVWGCAAPGAEITVKCRHQTKQTPADAQGHWLIQLDPMDAGEPLEMAITDGRKTVRLTDVLVGEVWLGSGQSNMEVAAKPLPQFATAAHPFDCDEATRQLLEAGAQLDIRISAVTRDHWKNPRWTVLSKENYSEAPALMTCVAALLREKLGVPVGIIVRCESSSTSGIWLSRNAVENDPDIQRQIRHYATNEYPKLLAAYPRRVKEWEVAAAKAKGAGAKIPVKPAAPTLPGGFPINRGFAGNVFYSEGRLDHYGANYVTRIRPVIPFAVRGIVWDQGENGTGIAGADQTAVMPALVRSWRAVWGDAGLPFIYLRKNQHPPALPEVMARLPDTFQVDNRGLSQITHPPDKSAYARRVLAQMELHIYK